MVLFNEVRALAETSQEAFTHFYNIMSRKDSAAKDVLYIRASNNDVITLAAWA